MAMTIEKAVMGIVNVNTSSYKKMSLLGFVDHYFEYVNGAEYEKQAVEISNKLIIFLNKETDEWVRDVILSTLLNLCCYLPIESKIDLCPIARNINNFNVSELSYVVDLLGWSGNEGDRKLIEQYKEIPELFDGVKVALTELDYRNRVQ